MNSIIEKYLKYYTNFKDTDWNNFLYLSEFNYDNSIQDSTNFSPFITYYSILKIPSNTDVPWADKFIQNFVKLTKMLKKNLQQAIKKQKEFA